MARGSGPPPYSLTLSRMRSRSCSRLEPPRETPTTGKPGFPRLIIQCSRSEEHTSELQSHVKLVCRLLLEKKTHQLSGGQRQRIMIAMALVLDPALLIADEPTTALDVTTQSQILKLIAELQKRHGTGVLFITHDFGVVAEIAHRVAVLRLGELVQLGPREAVLRHPH